MEEGNKMSYFEIEQLINKYGSWVRVQVAFYDFIFEKGIELCPTHFRLTLVQKIITGGFADGEDLYERSVKKIEQIFPSFELAWKAFLDEN